MFLDRNRGAAYLTMAISSIGMLGVFLFLTFYLSTTLGFTPVETGLAFMPMIGAIMASAAALCPVLTARFGPRPMVPTGSVLAAIGMVMLTRIGLDTSYTTGVLPALLVFGFGVGLVLAPVQNAATSGVEHHDSGVASAMSNTAQHIGGSIGTALLSSFAATAASNYLDGRTPTPELGMLAAVESYQTVFWWSAGFLLLCGVVSAIVFRSGPLEIDPDAAPSFDH